MRFHLLFALLLFSAGACADINKWVDAQGKVHYSDGPLPLDATPEAVRIPEDHISPASANSDTRSLAEREAELMKKMKAREQAAEQADKQRQADQLKQQNCEKVRTSLRVLEDSPRVATYDAGGNRSYLDDAAREQRIEEARKAVSQYCE